MRESTLNSRAWLAFPVEGIAVPAVGMTLLSLMFLSAALWNGFPLIFYDTGAYLMEGLGHVFLVERAPVYAELLFLDTLWPDFNRETLTAALEQFAARERRFGALDSEAVA